MEKTKFENLLLEDCVALYKNDYFYNKSYAIEILEKCGKTMIKDFCEYGYFSLTYGEETIPMYYYQLDTKKIKSDLFALEIDIEEWANIILHYLTNAEQDIMSIFTYKVDGKDIPCLCFMHKEDYNKAMGKAS